MGIYFAMQLAGITSWWTGMMFGIGLALDVDERASLYSQVGLVLLSATLLFGSSTWFVLTSLAVAHDCWKEMKADLLDIVLLLRAEEVGLGCEIYEIFIQTNSNLGFHLCGFLIVRSLPSKMTRRRRSANSPFARKQDTPTVTSFISFLLIVVLGIVVEVV
jgi:N-acetylglutamate synthase-like GNAT family acetyltransferase